MTQRIQKLFHVWQGTQITDEEIYNSEEGEFPIITGHNTIKGYTKIPRITDVPCITIPSKGIVNKLYIQTNPFDANNTIALMPIDREKLDLEYFLFTQSDYLTSFISSKNTNNYLNKAVLSNIEVECPDIPLQYKIKNEYIRLKNIQEKLEKNIEKISSQLNTNLEIAGDSVFLKDVFFLIVGSDDKMTEKYAYDNSGNIPIYSGASGNNGIMKYTNRSDYNPPKEYITWSISGKAGTLYLRNGACCLTRDCGIMRPNDKYDGKINLRWFLLTQEKRLQEFAIGKEGLGRLKKVLIKFYPFIIPSKSIQDKIVEEFDKLIQLKNRLNEINMKIDSSLKTTVYVNHTIT